MMGALHHDLEVSELGELGELVVPRGDRDTRSRPLSQGGPREVDQLSIGGVLADLGRAPRPPSEIEAQVRAGPGERQSSPWWASSSVARSAATSDMLSGSSRIASGPARSRNSASRWRNGC